MAVSFTNLMKPLMSGIKSKPLLFMNIFFVKLLQQNVYYQGFYEEIKYERQSHFLQIMYFSLKLLYAFRFK